MVKTGEIKDNMFDLYALYNQHVRLFNFYKARKKMKSEEIKQSFEIWLKHCFQMSTLSLILF